MGGRRKQYEYELPITPVCDWYLHTYKHTHSYFSKYKKLGAGKEVREEEELILQQFMCHFKATPIRLTLYT